MRVFRADELRILAAAYCAATGKTLHWLGENAAEQPKLFERLSGGFSCTLDKAERASDWLAANWPADVPWPAAVPRLSTEDSAAAPEAA